MRKDSVVETTLFPASWDDSCPTMADCHDRDPAEAGEKQRCSGLTASEALDRDK